MKLSVYYNNGAIQPAEEQGDSMILETTDTIESRLADDPAIIQRTLFIPELEWTLFSQLSNLGFQVLDFDRNRAEHQQILTHVAFAFNPYSSNSGLSAVRAKINELDRTYKDAPSDVDLILPTNYMDNYLHLLNSTIDAEKSVNYMHGSGKNDFPHTFPFNDLEQQQLSDALKKLLGSGINIDRINAPILTAKPGGS